MTPSCCSDHSVGKISTFSADNEDNNEITDENEDVDFTEDNGDGNFGLNNLRDGNAGANDSASEITRDNNGTAVEVHPSSLILSPNRQTSLPASVNQPRGM